VKHPERRWDFGEVPSQSKERIEEEGETAGQREGCGLANQREIRFLLNLLLPLKTIDVMSIDRFCFAALIA
jgi:hypothetical protein